MGMRVSGKSIEIGEALRARAEQRIAQAVAKYFDGGYDGHVTLSREGPGFRTECALHLDSGVIMTAEANAQDANASFDIAAEHIEKQLRRYKRKLKDHHGNETKEGASQ